MNRNYDNICLPKFPSSMEVLLDITDPNDFCFVQAMDIVKKLSVNDTAYLKVPFNSDGRSLHPSQQKSMQKFIL